MKYLVLIALLSIAACATPTTLHPKATAEEAAQEEQRQRFAATENPFPPIVEPVARTGKMKERLQKIAMRVNPEATRMCHELFGQTEERRCVFQLEIDGNRGVNAYADGNKVVVSAPMMLFAEKDNHLAFVVAHELAHNIMDHVGDKVSNSLMGVLLGATVDVLAASQGMNTQGGFTEMGLKTGAMVYSPAYEHEADYIALYILARAGYPIEEAPNFWRLMAQFEPDGIYVRTTHPTYPERFVSMLKTISEIRQKQKEGKALLPNFAKKG